MLRWCGGGGYGLGTPHFTLSHTTDRKRTSPGISRVLAPPEPMTVPPRATARSEWRPKHRVLPCYSFGATPAPRGCTDTDAAEAPLVSRPGDSGFQRFNLMTSARDTRSGANTNHLACSLLARTPPASRKCPVPKGSRSRSRCAGGGVRHALADTERSGAGVVLEAP